MQNGDISNDYEPTMLVIFEGLLGLPPEEGSRKPWWRPQKSDAVSQISRYEINMLLLAQIRRVRYPVEVVTFLGPDFVPAIEHRLETLHALVRNVWYTTPSQLTRIHIGRPDVGAIYDPDPSRAFAAYGSLGRHLPPASAPKFGE